MKTNAVSPFNLRLLFPTTLPKTLDKFATCEWGKSIVVLLQVPILDVSTKVPNAGIVHGGDCEGGLLAWLGPISSFGNSSSMFSA